MGRHDFVDSLWERALPDWVVIAGVIVALAAVVAIAIYLFGR